MSLITIAPKSDFRRAVGFIYPKFQIKLIVINAVVTNFVFCIIVLLFFRLFSQMKQLGVDSNFPESHGYFKFLDFQKSFAISYLLIGGALVIALTSISTLILSHRLAGPIVRLREHLIEIGEGTKDPTHKINFRSGDFFSDLPESVNEALLKAHQGNHRESLSLKAGSNV